MAQFQRAICYMYCKNGPEVVIGGFYTVLYWLEGVCTHSHHRAAVNLSCGHKPALFLLTEKCMQKKII